MERKNILNVPIKYSTKISIVPTSIHKLNPEFSLCDVDVMYIDENRNGTDISKEVVEDAIYSLYGVPIVGEWLEDEKRFGDHGEKIEITKDKITCTITTKPIGFVTKDAVDNAKWIKKPLPNGHELRTWLRLNKCILWTGRYEEAQSIIDNGTFQSMEVKFLDGDYKKNGYFKPCKMIFSALCAIGVEPCFEESNIRRAEYNLDSFKLEVQTMLDEYKKFNESDGISTTATTIVQNNATNNNPHMEGETKMDFAKIKELLSKSDDNCKYRLLNITENKVFALDLADYKPYAFNYAVTKIEDAESIIIDFESKTEMSLSATNKIADENFDEFSIKNEIDTVKEEYAKGLIADNTKKISESLSEEFKQDYDKLKESYDTLSESYKLATDKLAVFEKKEAELKEKAHKEEIDNLVNTYAEKLGKYSKFLVYKAQIEEHYSKSVDEVRQDLIFMAGNYLTSQENSLKRNFSYVPTEAGVTGKRNETVNNKYGHLLDKYIK